MTLNDLQRPLQSFIIAFIESLIKSLDEWTEACPGFFFIRGRIALEGGRIPPPPRNSLPLEHNTVKVKEYIIITKYRLILASAPYAQRQHECFFHQGQKHTILYFIRGIFRGGIFHPGKMHQGHNPLIPHGSTRLFFRKILL